MAKTRNIYANKQILTDWADFPSNAAGTLIKGVTTDPAFGTVALNKAQWRRNGPDLEVRWDFYQSAATGAASGSGAYLFKIPTTLGSYTNVAIDVQKATANTTADGSGRYSGVGTMFMYFHNGSVNYDGSGVATVYDSASIKVDSIDFNTTGGAAMRGIWGSTYFNFGTALNFALNLTLKIPISGWSAND